MTRIRHPLARAALLALPLAALAGCGDMSGMRATIATFGGGVQTTVAAQKAFYASGRQLECDADFTAAASDWAAGTTTALPDLVGCAPTVLDDPRLATRTALLDALTLYADALERLAGPADDNALGDAERDLATKLNALASSAKLGLNGGAAGATEAAIIALSNLVLDRKRFHDARAAAASVDGAVARVVDTLELENRAYGAALASALGRLQLAMRAAMAEQRQRGGAGVLDLAEARRLLRETNPFGPLRPADLAAGADLPAVAHLNAALEEVKKANHQLATAPNRTLRAAVKDLARRAQQARDDQVALGG